MYFQLCTTEELNILFVEETYQDFIFNCLVSFTVVFYDELRTLLSFYSWYGLSSSSRAVRQVIPCILSSPTFILYTTFSFSLAPPSLEPGALYMFHVPSTQIKGTCPNYLSYISFPK